MSNPCECLFSHETMMRQLLSLLNEAQTECTDTDCTTSDMTADTSNSGNMMMLAMLWGVFAMLMFFFRPNSLRSDSASRDGQTEGKPTTLNNNNNGPPPPDVN